MYQPTQPAKIMTKKQAIKELKEAQQNGDIEVAHCDADNVLCEFLKKLGHWDVVAEYEKVDKWYA